MAKSTFNIAELDKAQIQTRNFRELSTGSWNNETISAKNKHLIAVAIAQATNCQHCLLHHAKAAQQDGASFDEIAEISYLTGAYNIAGDSLLALDANLYLDEDKSGISKYYISPKALTYVNQQLDAIFVAREIKILALFGIAKYKGNRALADHLLTLAHKNGVDENRITEALLVVDILSSGIVYSNNQDIYQYLYARS